MRGGCGLIYRRACTRGAPSWRAVRDDGVPRVRLPRGILIHPRQQLLESSSVSVCVSFFDPIFEGSFGGLPELKMGHASYRRKDLDVFFPTIPVRRGMFFGEPRVPRRSRSRYLSNAPGLADQLVAKAVGMFLMPRGHLLIEIPAQPEELLTIRKLHVVAGVTLLHKDLGLQTKLQRVGENLCANVASQIGFRLGLRASPSGVQMDIPRVEKDRTRCEEAVRGSKGSFGVEVGTGAGSSHAARDDGARGPTLKRAARPFALISTPIDDQFSPTRPIGDHPSLKPGNVTVWILKSRHVVDDLAWVTTQVSNWMSGQGSGSGGPRRSDRLAKGKAVLYEPESPPDTDDEYDAMEDVRTRVDASIARNLQAELDAEAAGLASSAARPSSRPGITIGRSARPSGAPRQPAAAPAAAPPARSKRQRSDRAPLSADPIPEDYAAPGFRYPPHGGIRLRYPVTTPMADTPLLTGLHGHPLSSVRRCEDPPESIGRGGWSEFCQLLEIARPGYRDFLVELGFGPFLSIRYVHVWHPLVRCWVERFFHHTGTIHLSTCEMGVLLVDWNAILGVRFGGRIPPSDPVSDFEALEILGIDDPAAIVGKKLFYLRISYLRDLLVREIEEPPTELRYRQWTAYFIFSCFLGNDKSTIPTPIVGMFRDIDDLRDYDWGALTYGFYIRGLRRFSRRQTASFLGFWQFTLFWAFEHFAVFAPSRLPAALDSVFPLARRWDSAWIQRLTVRTLTECRTTVDCIRDADIVFQPYSTFLLERPELGGEALVPVDPPQLMTIEDYIPRAPSDSYVEGVKVYPDLIRADVPYREWFEQVSLGPLMSLHEVEGGRVMGGSAMDSHLFQSSGEIERLENEILRLQLELSVSEDCHAADMDRVQGEMARMQMEATQRDGAMAQMQADLVQRQRDLDSQGCGGGSFCGHRTEIRGAASGLSLIRFLTSGPILGFRVDPRLSGRNLRPSDRPRLSHRKKSRWDSQRDWRVARDHHAPISAFLSHAPPSNQQPFLEFLYPFFTKNSPFFPFLSPLGSMASSSNDPDSLVTLHFHDFRLRVDRGLLEALCFLLGSDPLLFFHRRGGSCSPPWRSMLGFFSWTALLVRQPLQRDACHTHSESSVEPSLGEGLYCRVKRLPGWKKFLTINFIAGKKGWKKFRINAFKIAFAGIFLFPTSAGRIDLGVIPLATGGGGPDVLLSASSALVLQSLTALSTASRPLTTLREHTKCYWGPAVWKPWTHCALFDGVPLPGVWGCTGYYPSLALRQFGGVQYPPRLGDLDAVTFDYIPSEDMWRLLLRIEDIWGGHLSEIVLIEDGSPGDSSVTSDFVEWRERWTPSFTLRPTVRPGALYSLVSRSLRVSASTGQSERTVVLERELEEARAELASLRLARASERDESCGNSHGGEQNRDSAEATRIIWRRSQRGNVSTLPRMNDFIREQLEISRAKDELMEETLTETQGQLRLSRKGFPVVTALHQINQVMDSLGARARAVWEEHDEGDPALSTALGRFCRETCIRLGH
uniref:Aminotransferase-like plant mobile domain-containing protein n=1 Tax=Fagus sylvatica TaxID=28930 RepID=A0A2N9IMC4_FAGSY